MAAGTAEATEGDVCEDLGDCVGLGKTAGLGEFPSAIASVSPVNGFWTTKGDVERDGEVSFAKVDGVDWGTRIVKEVCAGWGIAVAEGVCAARIAGRWVERWELSIAPTRAGVGRATANGRKPLGAATA